MSLIDKNSLYVLLERIEFFSFEHELWYRLPDGTTARISEKNTDMIAALFSAVENFYPKAFAALSKEYKSCRPNITYFRFKVVARFLRCNFSILDNVPDVANGLFSGFEYVACPLRGECPYECVICRPEFNHKLSAAEMRVMSLWYTGLQEDGIAEQLCISPYTVHNHVRNSYIKLAVHTRAEFVKYVDKHNLFR